MKRLAISFVLGFGALSALAQQYEIPINDASFEQETALLPTPLVDPPLTGHIGGWDVSRSGLAASLTGLTAPDVGTYYSEFAPDGWNVGYSLFAPGILADTMFDQTLDATFQPNTCYHLTVVVGVVGLPAVLADSGLRLLAGDQVVCTSDDPAVLTRVNLDRDLVKLTIHHPVDEVVPVGNIRVQLFSKQTLSVLTCSGFDQVRLLAESRGCVGEMTGDASVDMRDLAMELADYGCNNGTCSGDLDCDGDTDIHDLTIELAHYGARCD